MKPLLVGVNSGEGPPVPIPNTEVKLISAEDTWREAARENRAMPTSNLVMRFFFYVFLAFDYLILIKFFGWAYHL